jgi:hypothetical protein
MRGRTALLALGIALSAIPGNAPAASANPAEPESNPSAATGVAPSANPADDVPVSRVHRYRMAGRIRPLLFWMGRDRVGLARITWRDDERGHVGYELLVGTDPAVAPRGINRWGYIAEERRALDGAVLALMSRSDEASLDEVEAREGRAEGEFRVLRGLVRGDTARAQVTRVRPSSRPTIHDVDALLSLVGAEVAQAASRTRALEPATRPGFLGTVAELLGRDGRAGAPGTGGDAAVLSYVFAQSLYTLRLDSTRAVQQPVAGRTTAVPARRARFEITNVGTGRRTAFEIVHGTAGALDGVPLFIAWQPRWWLKVELHLDE